MVNDQKLSARRVCNDTGLRPPSATTVMHLVRGRVLTPISAAFALLAMFFAVDPELPTWVIFAPLAASVLLFGLPHGALDHLVPARLAGKRASVASIAVVAALYVVVGAGVLVVWNSAPLIAFAGFIMLTWFHWGQGDLWIDLAAGDVDRLCGPVLRAGTVFVRGGIPLLLPLLFHPGVYEKVRLGTIDLFADTSNATTSWAMGPVSRLSVGSAFGIIVLGMALATWRTARTHLQRIAWARDQVEIAVLAFFFALGPPVLTIGIYFCLWHALRHIIRLELLDPRGAVFLSRGRLWKAARRFAVDAAPITAIAVVVLGAVYFMLPTAVGSAESRLGPYLVLISALTVPHIAIVTYMDHRQNVRTPGPAGC